MATKTESQTVLGLVPGPGSGDDRDPTPKATGDLQSLEALEDVNHILVSKQIHLLDVKLRQRASPYYLHSPDGTLLYTVEIKRSKLLRPKWFQTQGYTICAKDNGGQGFTIEIPEHCCCRPPKVKILSSSMGELLGTVRQARSTCFGSVYYIYDVGGNVVLQLQSTFCKENVCETIPFELVSPEDKTICLGYMTTIWAGWGEHTKLNSENFSITFPKDLSVRLKAVVIGACLLIDFAYLPQRK